MQQEKVMKEVKEAEKLLINYFYEAQLIIRLYIVRVRSLVFSHIETSACVE